MSIFILNLPVFVISHCKYKQVTQKGQSVFSIALFSFVGYFLDHTRYCWLKNARKTRGVISVLFVKPEKGDFSATPSK